MIGIACGAAQWPLVAVAALIGVVMLTGLRLVERRWLDPWHAKHPERPESEN
jgi:putative Mg2+ transporter-C (MgtC) family protein